MKKWICNLLLCITAVLFCCTVPVYALTDESTDASDEEAAVEQELMEASGAEELFDFLPEETRDFLRQSGVDELSSDTILNLSGGDFLHMVGQGILVKLREPLALLATLLGVVLLSSLLGAFEMSFDASGLNRAFQVVSVLCISAIIVTPVMQILQSTTELIQQVGDFLLSFIPVFTGIISVSGKPLSAFAYNATLVGVVEAVSFTAQNLLIPLSGVYLALCLTGAVSDQIQIGGITRSIKKVVLWALGFLMTIFIAILTIKSFVANSADSVTLRAGKYLIGSFVPVVGGAVSDALTVLQGSFAVVRSTVGAFDILAILICFLPGIVSILLMNTALKIAQIVSDMLSVKRVSGLLEATSFVLTLMQSILICYGVMVLISISLMLVMGLGL